MSIIEKHIPIVFSVSCFNLIKIRFIILKLFDYLTQNQEESTSPQNTNLKKSTTPKKTWIIKVLCFQRKQQIQKLTKNILT